VTDASRASHDQSIVSQYDTRTNYMIRLKELYYVNPVLIAVEVKDKELSAGEQRILYRRATLKLELEWWFGRNIKEQQRLD
jgi:hypothetical protein